MEAEPLSYRIIDEPIPDRIPTGRPARDRETMFDLLGTMGVGQAIEVNRALRSVQYYVQRFRFSLDPGSQFVIRRATLRLTKIWRVK